MTSVRLTGSVIFCAFVACKIAFVVEGGPMRVAKIPSDATLVHIIELFLGKGEAFHSLGSLPSFSPPKASPGSPADQQEFHEPEGYTQTSRVIGEVPEESENISEVNGEPTEVGGGRDTVFREEDLPEDGKEMDKVIMDSSEASTVVDEVIEETSESVERPRPIQENENDPGRWSRSFEAAEDDTKKAPFDLEDAYQATWD